MKKLLLKSETYDHLVEYIGCLALCCTDDRLHVLVNKGQIGFTRMTVTAIAMPSFPHKKESKACCWPRVEKK